MESSSLELSKSTKFQQLTDESGISCGERVFISNRMIAPSRESARIRVHETGTRKEMTSEKQRLANRSNARRSAGPRTGAGKAASSRNAYKHGLTAKAFVVGDEDPTQFEHLRARLQSQYRPQCEFSNLLIDQLASQLWRLRRVPMLEAAVIEALSADVRKELITPRRDQRDEEARRASLEQAAARFLPPPHHDKTGNKELIAKPKDEPAKKEKQQPPDERKVIGLALIRDSQRHDALGKLARYEVRLMNGVLKTVRMLRQLELQQSIDASPEHTAVQ